MVNSETGVTSGVNVVWLLVLASNSHSREFSRHGVQTRDWRNETCRHLVTSEARVTSSHPYLDGFRGADVIRSVPATSTEIPPHYKSQMLKWRAFFGVDVARMYWYKLQININYHRSGC